MKESHSVVFILLGYSSPSIVILMKNNVKKKRRRLVTKIVLSYVFNFYLFIIIIRYEASSSSCDIPIMMRCRVCMDSCHAVQYPPTPTSSQDTRSLKPVAWPSFKPRNQPRCFGQCRWGITARRCCKNLM